MTPQEKAMLFALGVLTGLAMLAGIVVMVIVY
jgi:hypothetical protein